MSRGEPRPYPEASNAERVLTLGAVFTVVYGFISIFMWFNAGASLATLADITFIPLVAFACGVGLRVLGTFLTGFSDRTGIIALGDVAAFVIFAIIAIVTGSANDSSGSVGLAAVIGIGFGLPLVALLSVTAASAARFRRVRQAVFAFAFIFGLAGIIGYGSTFWN